MCRGALGYVALPARSGKYLPAGRTGRGGGVSAEPGLGSGIRGDRAAVGQNPWGLQFFEVRYGAPNLECEGPRGRARVRVLGAAWP